MPCLEILEAPISDAFLNDENLLNSPPKLDGVVNFYVGKGLRSVRKLYLFVVWETYEHHIQFNQDPENRVKIAEFLTPALGGKPTSIRHVELTRLHESTLEAPVTEIAFLGLNSGLPDNHLEVLNAAFENAVAKAVGSHPPAIHGYTKELADVYGVFVGWDSIEAHADNAANLDPEFVALLAEYSRVNSLDFASLKKLL
ncbi:hypothetical protein CC1G_07138 [Coprinopsis cinerea okayama7|uniref:ABM domain-containing protein n=1 Tax=Coprinopsis cinerea (strain Okayama-7 / 130 / ATCC MYA-4618 / FGSC 9003) TaxID=240176 RepID=A8NR74_COPC7|nr:hypothetical protein CC1G_07138 [Coprinopsis cinerea okayama7\|eukprot:XP_001835714.1 hypothetical protein CC1G_07138 [Coprinopsis cinerea okayama7\